MLIAGPISQSRKSAEEHWLLVERQGGQERSNRSGVSTREIFVHKLC